jgi:hypothetical protein
MSEMSLLDGRVLGRALRQRDVTKANISVCKGLVGRCNKTKLGAGDGNRTFVLSLES